MGILTSTTTVKHHIIRLQHQKTQNNRVGDAGCRPFCTLLLSLTETENITSKISYHPGCFPLIRPDFPQERSVDGLGSRAEDHQILPITNIRPFRQRPSLQRELRRESSNFKIIKRQHQKQKHKSINFNISSSVRAMRRPASVWT